MTIRSVRASVCVGLLASAGFVCATAAQPAHPRAAEWAVTDPPRSLPAPGVKFQIELTARIRPGWHIYAMQEPENGPVPTEIGLAESEPLELLAVDEPQAMMVPDPVLRRAVGMFQGTVFFSLHLRSLAKPAHKATAHILVRYQSCNERLCLPPRTETIPLSLE